MKMFAGQRFLTCTLNIQEYPCRQISVSLAPFTYANSHKSFISLMTMKPLALNDA